MYDSFEKDLEEANAQFVNHHDPCAHADMFAPMAVVGIAGGNCRLSYQLFLKMQHHIYKAYVAKLESCEVRMSPCFLNGMGCIYVRRETI